MSKRKKETVQQQIVESKILLLRGKRIMLDRDLAELYGVETKVLNQAVKRNLARFPSDFMFQLRDKDIEKSRSQIVTLNGKRGQNTKYLPYAFTENGIAMLSSVLKSERAIMVNIQIMPTFTRLREILSSNRELRQKIEELEDKCDQQFKAVFEVIRQILHPREKQKPQIGFRGKL
ncbi:MAG: ORF6N domain-containing protein [Candidatus Wallbacteria bacterium]|nr:ORF6N domain-containing protein [Candidatus Wallbacteria bacterium]